MRIICEDELRNYISENEADDGKILLNSKKENIKQSFYELRASEVYHNLSEKTEKKNTIVKGDKQYILIKPNSSVVIITKEKLDLPNNVMARVYLKGSFFSLGITAVSTVADVGFKGQLGIVCNNVSKNYLKIPVDKPIAKLEFIELDKKLKNVYIAQHGYESEIWPFKQEYIATKEDLKNDRRYDKKNIKIKRHLIENQSIYMIISTFITLILSVIALIN